VGFVLTYLGVTSLLTTRWRGPVTTGRYAARERHAPTYVRVGPVLLAAGVLGLLLFH
jgi:hypothetical protein